MIGENSFEGGMNQDYSKLKYPQNNFLEALNFRVITDEGLSTLALENTKGTLGLCSVPNAGDLLYIKDSLYSDTIGDVDFIFANPTGGPSEVLTVSNILTLSTEELYIIIKDFLETTGFDEYYKVFYNSTYIVIQVFTPNITVVTLTVPTSSGIEARPAEVIVNSKFFTPFILGWGILRDEIILIVGSASSVSETPDPTTSPGQVWKFRIDERTNQVIGASGALIPLGNPLDPSVHLVYNNQLNFSRYYNIYNEVKTRYESPDIGTVAWTDFYNKLRIINVYDPQVAAVPPSTLDYLPGNEPTLPVITGIINGGLLVSGTYMYFYRLKTVQGSYTTYSPLSAPIQLGPLWNPGQALNSTSPQSNTNVGADPGTSTQKSVQITYRNLDTTYDILEVGYVILQTEDSPEAFIFNEVTVPENGIVTIVHNGTEDIRPIEGTIGETLNNSNKPPDTFKTLEVVRNRLYAANGKSRSRKITYDARAYRFNSSQVSNMYDTSQDAVGSPQVIIDSALSVTINGVPGQTLEDIPDPFNLVNPYNNENPLLPVNTGGWSTVSQYKYQVDGTTLGGQGPNISYTFVVEDTDRIIGTLNPILPIYKPASSSLEPTYDPGNGYTIPRGNLYPKDTSAFDYQQTVGYARGETYRFGIVFYDKAGYPFLVEWIGDIRIPDTTDNGFQLNEAGSQGQCFNIGIAFSLDTTTTEFQELAPFISGWQFVRLERDALNKTKLGIGIHHNLVQMNGVSNSWCWLLNSQTTPLLMNSGGTSNSGILLGIDTPNFACRIDNQYIAGDYIKLIGQTAATPIAMITVGGVPQGEASYFISPIFYALGATTSINLINRAELNYVTEGETGSLAGQTIYNMADQITSGVEDFTQAACRTNVVQVSSYTPTTSPNLHYIVSYERYLNEQYGGNTRFDRYGNEYIATGGVYTYRGQLGTISLEVWGGDCYTTFFDLGKFTENNAALTSFDGPAVPGLNYYSIVFPSEAHSFNPQMRGNDRRGRQILYVLPTWPIENLDLNPAYKEVLPIQRFYSQFFNVSTIEETPHNIYVTDRKFDGQQLNSWRNFRVLDTMTVNGSYGQINKLIELKGKLLFYQTDAVGITANEERASIAPLEGGNLTLGTGGILERYDYLSTDTGSFNQFAVAKSGSAVYHYDIYLNKLFVTAEGGLQPLTDVKGLSGFFRYAFSGDILDRDQLFMPERVGIHAVFNPEYNSILFSFQDDDVQYTISYNEALSAFDSFHSFYPSIYLNTRRRLHSVYWDGTNHNAIYTHWKGPRNFYYETYHPSYIKLLTNGKNPFDKTWDNQEWRTELTLNGTDLQESISRVRFSTDYQTTNIVSLIPNTNFKRLIRTWRLQIPFDQTNPALVLKPRMVDKHIITEAWFDPTPGQDKKLLIHDLVTEFSTRAKILPK